MSGVLQGSWGLGFALSALAYGFLFDLICWRGLLWHGILPAFVVVWIRYYGEGAGSLGREQAPAAGKQGRGEGALALHLQARLAVQHADGLLVDGERLLRLLLDLGKSRCRIRKPKTGGRDRPRILLACPGPPVRCQRPFCPGSNPQVGEAWFPCL
jgi:MFS family permease